MDNLRRNKTQTADIMVEKKNDIAHKDIEDIIIGIIEANQIKIIPFAHLPINRVFENGSRGNLYKSSYRNQPAIIHNIQKFDNALNFSHELIALSTLDHSNIRKFLGLAVGSEGITLVHQYKKGKTITDMCSDEISCYSISNNIKFTILKQLGKLLAYIHHNEIIYRNLIPSKVLYSSESDKIYLLGCSKAMLAEEEEILANKDVVLYYSSPEYYNSDGSIKKTIGYGADIWAYGCLVIFLFTGKTPWKFKHKNDSEVLNCLKDKVAFPIPEELKQYSDVYKIVKGCTMVDLNERWSGQQLDEFIGNMKE